MPQMEDASDIAALARPLTSWALSDSDYRLMVEAVSDYAIFFLDPHGYVLTWNTGARRLNGYQAEEIIGRHFSVFYPQARIDEGWPDQELRFAAERGRFEDEGWRLRKDGTRFWANVIITKLVDESGEFRGFSKITRDLTERREAQEQLRLSEERFRLLVDGVKDYAIFMLDPDGHIVSWNAGAQKSTGYSTDEALGRHFTMFKPTDAELGVTDTDEVAESSRAGRFETQGWRLRKGGIRYWASVLAAPLYDDSGIHRGYAMVMRDLSDRRRIDMLEDESRRITTFIAMLGHELRNPLSPIANALQLLDRPGLDAGQLRAAREVIGRHLGHITHLVDDLLDVGRITSGKIRLDREMLRIADAVREASEIGESVLRANAHRLNVEIEDENLWMLGDRARIVQVLGNLLTNAAKFTPPGGRITLRLSRRGNVAEISVRDNGSGIPSDLLPDIFNLFVQGEQDVARPQGGLGLGLTLVRQLVTLHGGDVTAYSSGRPGEGAEFIIQMPLRTAPPEAPPANAPAVENPQGRILVVDDNRDAADTMAFLLETFGYETRVAYDGRAALDILENDGIDLALLDVGLPGISGLDLARMMAARFDAPELIAVSGYGQDKDSAASLASGFRLHMTKPVDTDELLAAIARLLHARRAAH
jgi:PAS domain S-box-containing protein